MRYRKLKGSKLFTGQELLNENNVLILDENNVVQDIVPAAEAGTDIEEVNGILLPGFINCHCHIELSHMQKVIPSGTGLVDFLLAVVQNRNMDAEQIRTHINAAEKEMYNNGIDGVADICNTTYAIETKKNSRIRWHNLIEVINMFDANMDKKLAYYTDIWQAYQQLENNSVLTPHAPYTVSTKIFEAINVATAGQIISIHNEETAAENELFQTGKGDFLKLYAHFGLSQSPFAISGTTSLQTYLPYFTNGQTIILVHNTFITEDDILFAQQHAARFGLQIIYCLCPNANLYIENKLPPVDLLLKYNCHIVLGTDSYSSNWQLNIASEIKTLLQHFPQLSLETVLQWATINGAKALHWQNDLGSFEKGKQPGVVVLDENTFAVKRIV